MVAIAAVMTAFTAGVHGQLRSMKADLTAEFPAVRLFAPARRAR